MQRKKYTTQLIIETVQAEHNYNRIYRDNNCTENTEVTSHSDMHKTIGDRAFPVAAARVWNMLPLAITSSPSRQTKRASKTELFRRQCTLAATAALTLA